MKVTIWTILLGAIPVLLGVFVALFLFKLAEPEVAKLARPATKGV